MRKIDSFQVNHLNLQRGVYVSRKDHIGDTILTTFDIRMKRPNVEPVLNTAELHAIEHLGATFLRNHETVGQDVVYFGPMGCRTGFYLILGKDVESSDVLWLIKEMFEFIKNYEGDIPGASPVECGNYLDLNLEMAKFHAQDFLENPLNDIKEHNLNYPK